MSLALTLRINADGSNARAGLRGVVDDLDKVGAAARKAGTDARQGGDGIGQAGTINPACLYLNFQAPA